MNPAEFITQLAERGIELWLDEGKLRVRGSQDRLTADIVTQLKAHKGSLVAHMQDSEGQSLSYAQRSLYTILQFDPECIAYNVACAIDMQDVELQALNQAYQAVLQRHSILRSQIVEHTHKTEYRVRLNVQQSVQEIELEAADDEEFERLIHQYVDQPFDLLNEPLCRLYLFRSAGRSPLLLLVVHHIVVDFWSLEILLAELGELYQAIAEGRDARLNKMVAQYADFVAAEREYLGTEEAKSDSEYWGAQLQGELPKLDFLNLDAEPAEQDSAGCTYKQFWSQSQLKKVVAEADRAGVSPYLFALAIFMILLKKYSANQDQIVGIPTSGRNQLDFYNTLGHFVNTLPLRTSINDNSSFTELLAELQVGMADLLDHQRFPFPRIVEQMCPDRSIDGSPIFQCMFNWNKRQSDDTFSSEGKLGKFRFATSNGIGGASYPLALSIVELEEGAHLVWNARLTNFSQEFVTRLAGSFELVLEQVMHNRATRVRDLILVPQMKQEASDHASYFPLDSRLDELIYRCAEANPEAIAIYDGEQQISYSALMQDANKIAVQLHKRGIRAGDYVAFLLQRTHRMIATIIGIHQAGAAYLPLDNKYPKERIDYMLGDLSPAIMICDRAVEPSWLDLTSPVDLTDLLDAETGQIERQVAPIVPGCLSSFTYTSGSTGMPKAVGLSHRNFIARLDWFRTFLCDEEVCGVFAGASVCFDLSLFEIFVPLTHGGSIILGEDILALADLPARDEVTVIMAVPPAMDTLVTQNGLPTSLRTVILGGDRLHRPLVDRLYALEHVQRVCNLYGPSEDSLLDTIGDVPITGTHNPSIGRKIDHAEVHILDPYLLQLPLDVVGEIYCAGTGLTMGYINQPAQTAEKFIPNPFADTPGERIYKSGDLGKLTATGEFEILGRVDNQVKLRGYRIELGEIENRLLKLDTIDEVAVIMVGKDYHTQRLLAFISLLAEESNQTNAVELYAGAAAINLQLAHHLPNYMLPDAYIRVDSLPKNNNGKIDRKALHLLYEQIDLTQANDLPDGNQTELRGVLASIWKSVLNSDNLSGSSHFFNQGGHSLLAAQTIGRVNQALDLNLPRNLLFEKPVFSHFLQHVSELHQEQSQPVSTLAICDQSLTPFNSVSPAQKRMWLLHDLSAGENHSAYHIGVALAINGELCDANLQRAINLVANSHFSLRCGFSMQDDDIEVQDFAPINVALQNESIELSDDLNGGASWHPRAQDFIDQPIDLEQAPLLRARLLRFDSPQSLDQQRAILLLVMHHAIADGGSLPILVNDILQSYASGESPQRHISALDYDSFSAWQRQSLDEAKIDSEVDYWQQALDGVDRLLDLPLDVKRPVKLSQSARQLDFVLPAETTRTLLGLCRKYDVTLNMLGFAAYAVLLNRYTNQHEFVIGTPYSQRQHAEFEQTIGLFTNTLPIPVKLDPEEQFAQFLKKVRSTLLFAYQHGDLPFDVLVDKLEIDRVAGVSPLVQASFACEHVASFDFAIADLDCELLEYPHCSAKFDWSMQLRECQGEISGNFVYADELFTDQRMQELLEHWLQLLRNIGQTPHWRLAALPLAMPSGQLVERDVQLPGRVDTACVDQLIGQVAEKFPDHLALSSQQGSLSYSAMLEEAGTLASVLTSLACGHGDRVGLLLPMQQSSIVLQLAIWQIGAVYVPIDINYPKERIEYVCEDAELTLLIVADEDETQQYPVKHLALTALYQRHDATDVVRPAPEPLKSGDDAAYLIYTSGSLGRPKGVLVSHRALHNLLAWHNNEYQVDPSHRASQLAGFGFDACVWETWPYLIAGANLVLAPNAVRRDPEALVQWLSEQHIDMCFMPTPLAQAVLQQPGVEGLSLRYLLTGGDRLVLGASSQLACPLVNHYGPTEFAVVATAFPVATVAAGTPPIGKPIADTHAYVSDPHGNLVPNGVVGELYLGGQSLSDGYFNRPDLTAERFLPDPFAQTPGARIYRTGDLVRLDADQQLCFEGRCDDQIKLRGYRIELGEIQNTAQEVAGVRQALAVLCPQQSDQSEDAFIAVYIVPNDPATSIELIAAVHQYLLNKLPVYMVPESLNLLDAVPLTANGKVDYRSLPEPDRTLDPGHNKYVAPRTMQEEVLVKIWEGKLSHTPIGVFDNFFAIGGHSLIAVQLAAKIQRQLGAKCSVELLFENPTVATLAQALTDSGQVEDLEPMPNIQANPAARYEPFPLSDVQQTYLIGRSGIYDLGDIATHVYMEIDIDDLDIDALNAAWRGIINRHDMLRMVITQDNEQRILKEVPHYQIDASDLRKLAAPELVSVLDQTREEMLQTTRSGKTWPLFENRISLLPSGKFRLHTIMDALIVDGWSNQVLAKELITFYGGKGGQLPPVNVSYRDYRLAEEQINQGRRYELSRKYWLDRLESLPDAPELPIRQGAQKVAKGRFRRRVYTLSKPRWAKLRELAKSLGITPSTLLLCAYCSVLAGWSKSPRFIINLTLFNRLPIHPDINQVVGDFTSLTLLEVDARQTRFKSFAHQLQRQLWRDLEHRHFSGVEVLREMARHNDGRQSARMPVVFTSGLTGAAEQDNWLDDLSDQQLDIFRADDIGQSQTSQVWLDHGVIEREGKLVLTWDAIEDLFLPGTLDAMFAAYTDGLVAMAEDPQLVSDIDFRRLPDEQTLARESYNATEHSFAIGLVHELVQRQVEASPDAIALIDGDIELDYATLWGTSTGLAVEIRGKGQKPNELVAIIMHKGWEQVVSSLAIMQSGAAYLPIDASLPEQRIVQILQQAEVSLVLAQQKTSHLVPREANCQVIEVGPVQCQLDAIEVLESVQSLDDLAYVIFTSGSTGVPKGVMIEHRAVVNTLLDINQKFSLGAHDRVLAMSSLSFDLSVFDAFGVLISGGAIVMPQYESLRDPAHWRALIEQHGVSVLNSVPALTQLLVEHAETTSTTLPASLRLVMMSGDWIAVDLPQRLRACVSPSSEMPELISLGGATEASIWSIYYPIKQVEEKWQSIPYGKPLANQTFHVLRDDLSNCPNWVTGHLYIGGVGLASGYWRNAELSSSSFIQHPVSGEPLYRTGDLGRFMDDGQIEFLGREDSQVKINGYRVELGDIEANLLSHPDVQKSVVVVNQNAGASLLGYVVLNTEFTQSPSEEDFAKLEFKGGAKAMRDVSAWPNALQLELPEVVYRGTNMTADLPPTVLTMEALGKWLGCLSTYAVEGALFAKRYYPSAGSLYPIQVYLTISENQIPGLAAGVYYYHPENHHLHLLADSTQLPAEFSSKHLELHFVANLGTIRPVYGDAAVPFCELEIGYMSELLHSHGSAFGLSQITPAGLPPGNLNALLQLDEQCQCLFTSSWLAESIPVALPDNDQHLALLERQSFRQFEGEPLDMAALHELIQTIAADECVRSQRVQLAVYCKAAASGEQGVALIWEVEQGCLVSVTEVDLPVSLHGAGNQELFKDSSFEIYLLSRDEHRSTLLDVGRLSQRLMSYAPLYHIGLCPVGTVDHELIQDTFVLSDDVWVIHSLVGGGVSAAQLEELSTPEGGAVASYNQIDDIKAFLAARLPEYMLPDQLIAIESMPLSSNGKVARDRLPRPEQLAQSQTQYQAPSTPLEKQLVEHWEAILDRKKVGVQDDFFALGGNSMLLVRMHQRLQRALQKEIAIMDLFRFPSITLLAQHLESPARGVDGFENPDQKSHAEQAQSRAALQRRATKQFGRLGQRGERT